VTAFSVQCAREVLTLGKLVGAVYVVTADDYDR